MNVLEKHTERITEWVTAGPYAVAVEVDAEFFPERPAEPFFNPTTVRYLEQVQQWASAGDLDAMRKAGTVFIRLDQSAPAEVKANGPQRKA